MTFILTSIHLGHEGQEHISNADMSSIQSINENHPMRVIDSYIGQTCLAWFPHTPSPVISAYLLLVEVYSRPQGLSVQHIQEVNTSSAERIA